MLVSAKLILRKAQMENFAVGQFNTSDLEITKAIISAASELYSPVIIGTSEKAIQFAGLEELASIIKIDAKKARVPIALHLDHGLTVDTVERCLKEGYTSIHFDASLKPIGKNIDLTGEVVRLCHQKRVTVEGELGAIGGREDYLRGDQSRLTDPDKAKLYVERTRVDSLAVSIGNAHGIPLPEEELDFDRLARIQTKVKVPLVLHGASSMPSEDIKKAIKLGVCKINIDTDIRLAFNNSIRDFLENNPDIYDPREIMESTIDAVKKVVKSKIMTFGSRNKG